MKTPFRLKRGTPSTVSTHHKSAYLSGLSMLENSTVAPSYQSHTMVMPIKQQSSYYDSTSNYQSSKYQYQDLSSINKLITEQLQSDKRQSIRNESFLKSAHFYHQKPTKDRIILGGPWTIPEKVTKIYDDFIQNISDKCQFKQGVLPKSSIYYFAIGQQVLFYDIGRAIKTGSNLSDYFMNQVHFQQTVYQIKQLQIKHSLFGQFKNKNLVLISHPWKFSFAALEFQSNLKNHLEKTSRWMRITQLNYSIQLNTQIAQKIIEGNARIYYMDKQSNINTVFIQANDWLNKFLGNSNRYIFTLNSIASNSDPKSYYIERKAGIFKRIRHFSKIFFQSNLCFSSVSTKNIDLVFDSKRQLLYSLVDTNISATNTKFLSNYKILSCWNAKNTNLQKICSISEQELYDLQIQSIANFNCTPNYQISKIEIIDPSLQTEANLTVLLECGIRLYFKVQKSFRLLQHQFPPSIDPVSKNIQAKQSSKRVYLTHNHYKESDLVFNLKEEIDNHTFIIWKPNQDKQDENYIQIMWGISMTSGIVGNPPSENYINRIGLGVTKSIKQEMLKHAMIKQNKLKSSSSSSVPAYLLHELAKNTLIHPQLYVHSTEIQIDYLCILRPVDKMMNALLADITDENVILKMFQGVSKNEIQALLIQIYCDKQGLYLKDLSLVALMVIYKKVIEVNRNQNYEKFLLKNQNQENKGYSGKFNKPKPIQPQMIPHESISQDTKSAILYLLKKLSETNEGVGHLIKQQIQCHEQIKQSIIIYLSRLLHSIWNKNLNQINEIELVMDFLNPILQIINHFLIIYNQVPIYRQKQIKNFVILRRNRQKDDSNNRIERKQSPLLKLRHYVKKIIQLIRLSCNVDLKLPKTFIQALTVQPESYQQYIFRMLVEKYSYPIQTYHQYKKQFSYFIRQNLEKSLKITQQIKNKKKSEVIQIIKFHKNVPDYLINYLEEKRILMNEDCKQILQNRITYQKIDINPHNPKQNIINFLSKLEGSNCSLEQRNKLLFRVKNLLSQYLMKNQGKQDKFYKQCNQATKQISKRLAINELLIMAYEQIKQPNNNIINELRTEYFQQQILQPLVKEINKKEITIIYKFLFSPRLDEQIQYSLTLNFRQILVANYEQINDKQKSSGIKFLKKIFTQNSNSNNLKGYKWSYFQDRVSLVYRKVRSQVNINKFINILNACVLIKDQNSLNLSVQLLENDIKTINKIIKLSETKEEIVNQIRRTLNYPLIGPMMILIGGPPQEIERYYTLWFSDLLKSNLKYDNNNGGKIVQLLYNWLNLYSLYFIIQTDGQALLGCTDVIIEFTKELLEIYQKTSPKEKTKQTAEILRNSCKLLSQL